ncbi:MAG: hypothetical protein L0210_01685 [Rhodospirillales bacterium]|nr:hypothetical protein [Rhodospirillales bacterium]
MRDQIVADLSTHLDKGAVSDLVGSYEMVVSRYRRCDTEGCLVAAGKFVEHTFRVLEYVRTGAAPAEIKSPAATARTIEADNKLPEPLRLSIPRVALGMVYEVRSKRGAVHVKEIDPRGIDAALAVHASSWVVAEFLRLYHKAEEKAVARAMQALMHGHIPFVEVFGDEVAVTAQVSCEDELLLLLSKAEPEGLNRRALGVASRCSPPAVTRALQRLTDKDCRYVHKMANGRFRIAGPGVKHISEVVAAAALATA